MNSPLLLASSLVPPTLVLVLCVVAGIGTVMLMPGRKEAPIRMIGGVLLVVAGLILSAVLLRHFTDGPGIYFWPFAAIALFGSVRVVTHPRPVYSALYFVLTVFASAGLFVLLWAEFMAAALVLIYAGAILVTYVFVIMLASQASTPDVELADPAHRPHGLGAVTEYDTVSREPIIASTLGFILMGILLFVVFDKADAIKPVPEAPSASMPQAVSVSAVDSSYFGSTQQLGHHLFNNHIVSLELAGLLLTISMVGAIVIARRRVLSASSTPMTSDFTSSPATPIDDDPHSIPVYGTDNPRQKSYPER